MSEKIYDWRELNLMAMDIIICAGNSPLSKKIAKFQKYTGAKYGTYMFTHVGGVYEPRFEKRLWVQESTTMNKWADKKGVQINNFTRWLQNYNGYVYVKKLDFVRTEAFYQRDLEFWQMHKDEDYENGIPGGIELLLCGLRLHRFVRWFLPKYTPKFTKNPHCTELQCKRLKWHKLIDQNVFINRMPPWIWYSRIDNVLLVKTAGTFRIK